MFCKICVEQNEQFLDLNSDEAKNCKASKLLYKYLAICFNVSIVMYVQIAFIYNIVLNFQEEPQEGIVCRKCWCQIELFHNFYTRIENIHRHQETIFVDSITPVKIEENEFKEIFFLDFKDDDSDVDDPHSYEDETAKEIQTIHPKSSRNSKNLIQNFFNNE